jgi:hypothetical protein
LKQVDDIMNEFDFVRVRKAMLALDWTWTYHGVPSVSQLRTTAEKLLRTAINIGGQTATGGFVADYSEGVLSLTFVVEETYV